MSALPFAGLKVLDFSWLLVGPITSKYLGMFGAEVIKIETYRRPDAVRMSSPYPDGKPGINNSALFANHNLSKKSMALNLDKPQGREIALRLTQWADVVLENFAPGVIKRLRLDYDELREVKPDIIMMSASMQGQTGPAAAHPGIGAFLQSLSGLDHLTGFPEGTPGGPGQVLPDFINPWTFMIALMCALEHRERTGEGQYVDFSQYEFTIHLLAPALMDYLLNGRVHERQGNRVEHAAPHSVYPCVPDPDLPRNVTGERWIAIACHSDQEWRALTEVMGRPKLADDPRFGQLLDRKQHEDELDAYVAGWTGGQDPDELMARLQKAGVPAARVHNGRSILSDPQLECRGHYRRLEQPRVGVRPFDGPAFRLSEVEPDVRPAPLFSQHNDYVLRDILDLSDDEIADLLARGVVDYR